MLHALVKVVAGTFTTWSCGHFNHSCTMAPHDCNVTGAMPCWCIVHTLIMLGVSKHDVDTKQKLNGVPLQPVHFEQNQLHCHLRSTLVEW